MFSSFDSSGEYHGTSATDIFVFASNFGAVFFYGHGGDDLLVGGGESAWLYGGCGNDLLIAGDGSNFLDGGPGCDRLIGRGAFTDMTGGAGADVFSPSPRGGAFAAIEDFQEGIDKIRLPAGLASQVHYRPALEGLFIGKVEIATVEAGGHAAHITTGDFLFI